MKRKFILFSISMLVIGVFITSETGDKLIGVNLVDRFYHPFVWSLALIPLSLLSLTLSDKKHKFWLKFTGIFFVVSMVLVFLSPEYDSGIVGFDRELMNWFFAGLYSVVSMVYFIVQYFRKDKNSI